MQTQNNRLKGSTKKQSADLFETLVEALTHTDSTVRESAIKEFSKRNDKRGIGPLVEMLRDEDSNIRFQAATALQELGWRPVTDSHRAFQFVALNQFQEAVKLGAVAVDPLVLLLNDENIGVRLAALETLAQIGGPQVVKPFMDVLKDENPHVRAVAIQALGRVGDPHSIGAMVRLANDPSWEVRSVLLDVLGCFQDPRCVEAMIRFTKDESPELRQRACELLGDSGDRRGISPLTAALANEDHTVRELASLALQKLDGDWATSEEARKASQDLLDALKHPDFLVREAAADALRLIGQTSAMNVFLSAETNSAADTALHALMQALRAENRDLRQAAAESLGRIGHSRALPSLIDTLRDEDEWVREAAVYSLNLMNWEPANDSEQALKAVILHRWEDAVQLGSAATEPLVMMLNAQDPAVCKGAIDSLGQIGDLRVAESLAVLLQHPEKMVRSAAAETLKSLGWQSEDVQTRVLQAIELQDWETAGQQGKAAVEPLVAALKAGYHDSAVYEGAAGALISIVDTKAAKPLLSHVRDGQIAEIVVQALLSLIEYNTSKIEADDLQAITALSNVFQFYYTVDERYGTYVRSGLQEVDTSSLKALARQELVRRGLEV